jgi:hypothetical protein
MDMKLRSLLAAAVALALALPGIATADRRGDDHHGYGDRHGYTSGHGHHRFDRDRHYGYGGYRGGYYPRYYGYDDNDDDLLLGLVAGGLLGYAINGAQQGNRYDYYDRYPPTERNAYPADREAYSNGSCLQEREYQTTVVVGGRKVPAYGTACLQPDGSWSREPPKLANY